MAIPAKKGICIDCGPDAGEKYIIADRCQTHYWKHRSTVKETARKLSQTDQDKQAQKKALDKWYVLAIEQMPGRCEECNERLIIFAPWAAKSFVAHVLGKALFKSVATHPINKVYLCLICHTNFDNWGEEKVMKMVIFPKILDISLQLVQHLHQSEQNKLPEYVKALI